MNFERIICEQILIELPEEMRHYNPYVRDFLQICQVSDEEIDEASIVITKKQKPRDAGTRTYTTHHLTEVSVVMPEQVGRRHIVVRKEVAELNNLKIPIAQPMLCILFFILKRT